jgi:hypothetical protein
LKIDGKLGDGAQSLHLRAGESRHITLSHAFAEGGPHRVQLPGLPEQSIFVPGGLSFALGDPVIALKLDEGKGSTTENAVTGKSLAIKGTPKWVKGRELAGLEPASDSAIDAGNQQLYRKSFTLAAWVKIDKLGEHGDLALFGGRAPMGADQDNTGTVLSAGLHNGKLFLGFQGREASGTKSAPLGTWVHLAFVYDADMRKASLYLDGKLDRTSNLDPYTGPLETIGDAPSLEHADYSMDEVVVAGSASSSSLVQTLAQEGFSATRKGEYVSNWQNIAGPLDHLDSFADLPQDTSASVIVEVGDVATGVTGSQTVALKTSHQSYPIKALSSGSQVRIRVRLDAHATAQSPTIFAISLSGSGGDLRWSTPREWSNGSAERSLSINDPAR